MHIFHLEHWVMHIFHLGHWVMHIFYKYTKEGQPGEFTVWKCTRKAQGAYNIVEIFLLALYLHPFWDIDSPHIYISFSEWYFLLVFHTCLYQTYCRIKFDVFLVYRLCHVSSECREELAKSQPLTVSICYLHAHTHTHTHTHAKSVCLKPLPIT